MVTVRLMWPFIALMAKAVAGTSGKVQPARCLHFHLGNGMTNPYRVTLTVTEKQTQQFSGHRTEHGIGCEAQMPFTVQPNSD
ncbi:MAG: hypothetical protein UZ17_ACD001000439 [Acidobacteria bacterium OLB17]|nr:MAG: hypothetical protein UZ17_ACD001000439 [Acidobacteria bacterium OLB17]